MQGEIPIPEDLREEYDELKLCAPRDSIGHYMIRIMELIERIAEAEQALTYSQQRNAEFLEQVGAMTLAMDRLKVELGEKEQENAMLKAELAIYKPNPSIAIGGTV